MDTLEQGPIWGFIGIILGILIYIVIRKRISVRMFFYVLFCYYIGRMLSLTLLPLPLTSTEKIIYILMNNNMVNFIPLINEFNHFSLSIVIEWALNILLFFPLGFLIPLTFKKTYSIKNILFLSFILSLSIELSQLSISYFWVHAGYRVCDINDLIFNTIGGIVGYYVFNRVAILLRKMKVIDG